VQGRRQVKICGVDRHGERGARAYNGGLHGGGADRTDPSTPHLKNSSDLYQFQQRPQAKVGWTYPPQSTPWRRHWCHVPLKSSAHLNTKLVCVEPRPSALNMTLPAFAAERRRRIPAIDRYLQQTATAAFDRRDRQTNGQPDRYIDPAPRPYYAAGSAKRMFCSIVSFHVTL